MKEMATKYAAHLLSSAYSEHDTSYSCQLVDTQIRKTQNHLILDSVHGVLTQY